MGISLCPLAAHFLMKKRSRLLYLGLSILFSVAIILIGHWFSPFDRAASATVSTLGPPISVAGDEPIEPLPYPQDLDPKVVSLGEKLFNEVKLSSDNKVSCASCHLIQKGGADGRKQSLGVENRIGSMNASTVLNASLHFRQFWDGRAETLESQIDGPINNELEMDSSWPEIEKKLNADDVYRSTFKQLYPAGVSSNSIKNALATYERSLVTPDLPFDRFLKGDQDALTAEQKEGYRRFKGYGCVACHQGVVLGGNLYQKVGLFGDYFEDRGNITKDDYGRFNVTGKEEDRFSFKVPTLRNIEHTAPYFHDGSVPSLSEAVRLMAKYQLGRDMPQSDIDLILKFLQTL